MASTLANQRPRINLANCGSMQRAQVVQSPTKECPLPCGTARAFPYCQNFIHCRNPGNSVSRIACKSAVSLTLLVLMVIPALLRAQSAEGGVVGFQERAAASAANWNFRAAETPAEAILAEPLAASITPGAAATRCGGWFLASACFPTSIASSPEPAADRQKHDESTKPAPGRVRNSSPPDFSRSIYYKNKIEFSLDGGWLPINIPFVFDVFLGDSYNTTSLKYTLVPIIGSLRWQIDDVGGPWILRGNWDLECSGAVTFIPRGPETRYFAWIIGFRRNFVPRRGRFAPYFDGRVGLGNIDAKEPLGVLYAQGQDFTFTLNMGSGVRYNFNPRYSISAGLNWMHISNLYLSQPQFSNYGINVYGPMFGFNVQLFGHRRKGSQ